MIMKKITIYILYNLLFLMAISIFCEAFVRVIVPQIKPQGTDQNLYVENRFQGSQGLKPNSRGLSNGAEVVVDSSGFRKTSIPIDTSKNGWLFLGDSVTMGIGVDSDSTFAGRIQSKRRDVNVLNPSMIGYNVNDYINVFNHFVIEERNAFKIREVFLFWCLNDIYTDADVIQMPGGKTRSVLGGVLNEIRRRTKIYFFIKTLLFDRPKTYFQFDSRLYADAVKLDSCVEKIALLNRESRARGIRFQVVLLPYEYQLRKNTDNDPNPENILETRFNESGIETLNLLPLLSECGVASKKLYLFGDGIHFSNLGHRIIAGYVWLNEWDGLYEMHPP
jgi:hypothetical protein